MRAAAVVLAAGVVLVRVGCPGSGGRPGYAPRGGQTPRAWCSRTTRRSSIRGRCLIESWSRVSNDRALAVQFTSGTAACNGVHATTTETADTVTVALTGGSLPAQAGRMCIMLALTGTLVVPLRSPLGDRQVFSAA